ncbi:MAG: carbohydrate ABC transporter permease [Sulfobacillus sp.]
MISSQPQWSRHLIHGLYLAILILGAVTMFVPFLWSLSTALKPLSESLAFPPQWWPHPVDVQNFISIWKLVPVARWFANSFLVASIVTVLNLVFDSMAGYALARINFPGKNFVFIGILSMLMVPFQSVMLPVYILLRALGLLDSYAGMILPMAVSAMGVFLMRQAFLTIPQEMEDAATIDGAGRLRMFVQISLPMVIPNMLTLALMMFLASWNNFLLPLLVANRTHLWTLPLGIVMFQQEYFVNWPLLMAAGVIATLPIALVYLLFQKWFIQGVASTGIK